MSDSNGKLTMILQEIHQDIRAIDAKLDKKADKADLDKVKETQAKNTKALEKHKTYFALLGSAFTLVTGWMGLTK